MTNYNYIEAVTEDAAQYIRDNYTAEELAEKLTDREEFAETLNDGMWIADEVTGNGSGSYTFDRAQAREYVLADIDTDTEEEEEEETMHNTFTPAEAAMHTATMRGIIRRQGGYRERDILNHPHTVERGETWNDAHKVVNVLEVEPQADGYRAGFAVDLVTRSIVG